MTWKSEYLVILVLIINALIAAVYLVWGCVRRAPRRAFIGAAILLCCPVVGPVFFFGATFVYQLFLRNKQVDLSEVSFSTERKQFVHAPDEEERELVPIEESLLVATHAERRKAFLNSIRLNGDKDIALYSKALENDDPETSHYSASIVMEAIANFQATLQELGVEYEKTPGDPEVAGAYAMQVRRYLDSGVLTGVELERYHSLYAHLLDSLREKTPEALESAHYLQAVETLIAMRELPRAEAWAKAGVERFPDEEAAHLGLMRVYYETGDQQRFLQALSTLKASYIELSRQGAALVRFYTRRA